ncbi:hypothetical protein I3760_06G101400 [Carya illinoinensis]|nr:hypothetical protein I3760_06G101400 [Carya illinoinensis]
MTAAVGSRRLLLVVWDKLIFFIHLASTDYVRYTRSSFGRRRASSSRIWVFPTLGAGARDLFKLEQRKLKFGVTKTSLSFTKMQERNKDLVRGGLNHVGNLSNVPR